MCKVYLDIFCMYVNKCCFFAKKNRRRSLISLHILRSTKLGLWQNVAARWDTFVDFHSLASFSREKLIQIRFPYNPKRQDSIWEAPWLCRKYIRQVINMIIFTSWLSKWLFGLTITSSCDLPINTLDYYVYKLGAVRSLRHRLFQIILFSPPKFLSSGHENLVQIGEEGVETPHACVLHAGLFTSAQQVLR